MHDSTFNYLVPTEEQKNAMEVAREVFRCAAVALDGLLPDGPDKTYLMRQLRTCGMWANVAITRHPDGSPRA